MLRASLCWIWDGFRRCLALAVGARMPRFKAFGREMMTRPSGYPFLRLWSSGLMVAIVLLNLAGGLSRLHRRSPLKHS